MDSKALLEKMLVMVVRSFGVSEWQPAKNFDQSRGNAAGAWPTNMPWSLDAQLRWIAHALRDSRLSGENRSGALPPLVASSAAVSLRPARACSRANDRSAAPRLFARQNLLQSVMCP